jgi:hypothetical protein
VRRVAGFRYVGHSDQVGEPGSLTPSTNRSFGRNGSTWPRVRVVTLIVALVTYVIHFYVALLFRDGPTPVGAWIVSGTLLIVFVIAAASLLAIRSRRWATILGVVSVGFIAAFAAFLVHTYRGVGG